MPSSEENSRQHKRPAKYPLLLTLFSGLSFVLILVLILLVGSSFETIEQRLAYKPPVAYGQTVQGSYDIEIVDGQTVYVPTYSHIYADCGKPHLLETTLSIRNLDTNRPVTLKSVNYCDTACKRVKQYLEKPLPLGALESTEFLVEKRDTRGGSGANFIVIWGADQPVYEPPVEAVMVGLWGNKSFAFSSPGRALVKVKE